MRSLWKLLAITLGVPLALLVGWHGRGVFETLNGTCPAGRADRSGWVADGPTAEDVQRAHGFTGERLLELCWKIANDKLARLGGFMHEQRLEDLVGDLALQGVQAALRYDERFHPHPPRRLAYGAIYRSSDERTSALDGWFWQQHRRRALGHQPSVSRTNLLGS
jgi:hypothetical protein